MSRIEKAAEAKGLRMTEQRRVIARVLSDATDHPDVETVYERASAIDDRIGLAASSRSRASSSATTSATGAPATKRWRASTTITSSTCTAAR
jgi:hypothetical protein